MTTFPARKLQNYAVPVVGGELCIGEVYFVVRFVDAALKIPELLPVAFKGKGAHGFRKEKFVFQGAGVYLNGLQTNDKNSENSELIVLSARELSGVYQFEDALDVILRCHLRREGPA